MFEAIYNVCAVFFLLPQKKDKRINWDLRFLIDTLHNLGFCSSYSEVKRFERCGAVYQTLLEESKEKAHFFQYVGDNVNYDIATIDGLNTFHGMGLIEVSTPEFPATELSVPRKEVSGDEMKSIGTMPFYTYQKPAKSQPRTFVCLTKNGDTYDNEWRLKRSGASLAFSKAHT